jgi:uncharacterized protein (UPF0305 family)
MARVNCENYEIRLQLDMAREAVRRSETYLNPAYREQALRAAVRRLCDALETLAPEAPGGDGPEEAAVLPEALRERQLRVVERLQERFEYASSPEGARAYAQALQAAVDTLAHMP